MADQLIIDALARTAQKKRILSPETASRLTGFLAQQGVTDLETLRALLKSGQGLTGDLARRLLALLPPPTRQPYGEYRPLTHLADGGMGQVWLAADPTDRIVVVKTMKSSLSAGAEFIKRFAREAQITQKVTHQNIVRCIDSGQASDGTLYMVLEYVEFGDLKDLTEAKGGLTEQLALTVLYQSADGLAEAHRHHLIHRDIKPANIFVAGDGRAKLADFGVARSTETNRTMLTMEGAFVGSPHYMSPEQVISDPNLDIRSDIYALGCVLYYCLAGVAPYVGQLQEVLHKHCTAPVPDIRRARSAVSERTAAIIAKAMAKDRKNRYQDPEELRAGVANALTALGVTPGKPISEEDTRSGDLSSKSPQGFMPSTPDAPTMASDLSGRPGTGQPGRPFAGMTPIGGTPRADADARTMVADLSGRPGQPAADADARTMVADLSGVPMQNAADADARTMVADLSGGRAAASSNSGISSMPTMAGPPPDAMQRPLAADIATPVPRPGHSGSSSNNLAGQDVGDLPTIAGPVGAVIAADTSAPRPMTAAERDAQTITTPTPGAFRAMTPAPATDPHQDALEGTFMVPMAQAISQPPARPISPRTPVPGAHDVQDDFGTMAMPGGSHATPTPTSNPHIGSGTHATIAATATPPASADPGGLAIGMEGDWASALAGDWVSLMPTNPNDPTMVMLFARAKVTVGKLREAPVDLCLRNYPVAVHKDACQRVSRNHCNLMWNALEGGFAVEDLGAGNGSTLDGDPLPANGSKSLLMGTEHILVCAGVIILHLRAMAVRGPIVRTMPGAPALGATTYPCGLEQGHGADSLIITRTENRPELSYALVLRRLSIGGPGCDIAIAGARTRAAVEIAPFGGRWLYRIIPLSPNAPANKWRPLAAGTVLDCGGKVLSAQPGAYPQFG